jgi:DNA-binding winged helix-turn-helix (wHTH) protein/tetratricopeptide (TPR) repeat protein
MKLFHGFRLDVVNHCLWRGDERVSLAPKAFDVLRYLVDHSNRLVTHEEILEALWPATYVNPEVVKKYVLGIRRVLGDQPDNPAFVATFPRRGYQFIAPVNEESSLQSSEPIAIRTSPIVGRGAALAELQDALCRATGGQRQIVFITGEAGIGKTTLVDAFQQSVSSSVRFARGHCVEGFGGKEAYYPVLDALGQLLRDGEDGPLAQAVSRRAPSWLVQFPYLLSPERRDTLEKEIVGTTRERMVREICEALELVTAQTRLVLCLEDLHWVDPSTLDFISALARRRGPARLLLLGTYRPADVIVSQSPLKTLKQDLLVHGLCREISLERLEESDVAEYLKLEFPDGDLWERLSSVVYRQSGGNALFMVAILQDMVKKGLLRTAQGHWSLTVPLEDVALSVPETLDQLIEVQFQQLCPDEQRVLRSASVAGEHFSVWAIATATELDVSVIGEICERLAERQQFIKFAGIYELANGQISAHYDFLHSFYREVFYGRLSEVSRSRLHLVLAQRLQAFCNPCEQELATELALHFEGGFDYEQAIRYLIIAAENAVGRFAYRDAIEILQHALELVRRLVPAVQADLQVRILDFIGYSYFALGDLPESAQAYEAAAVRADEAGLRAPQVQALISAMYPLGFISPDRGLAALDKAVQMSKAADDPILLAHTQMVASSCRLIFAGWCKDDADLCTSAQAALPSPSALSTGPYQQTIYAHVLALQGRYREALDLVESAIARTEHGISLIPHFGALSAKTLALLRLGRLGEVLQITRAGRESADENLARSWLLTFREAWLRLLVFDYEGAYRICESVIQTCGDYHPGQPLTISRVAAGYLALSRGAYPQAIEHFSKVHHPEVVTKFFLHWHWRMTAQLELGNAWLLARDLAQARTVAHEFLASVLATTDPHLKILAWDLQARIAFAEDDPAKACDHIDQAVAVIEKFDVPIAAWQAYASAWQLYRHAKKPKLAQDYRQRAKDLIHRIAGSFPQDEPLRATFLSAPPVRGVLGKGRTVPHEWSV